MYARRFSTLDLCAFDAFTLIVGSRDAWTERFDALKETMANWNLKLCLYAGDSDFDFVSRSHRELFESGAQLSTGGGLLVRPDQHILAMLTKCSSVKDMKSALREHLGL